VASRRMREFTERRAAAEAEVKRWSAELTGHDLAVAELSEPVRMRFEVAKHRAELIDAYVWRRRASYLTWLVRKHADGSKASSLLRSGWPERPAWAARTTSPDLASPNLPSPNLPSPNLPSPNLAQSDLASPDLAQPDLAGSFLAGSFLAEPSPAGSEVAKPAPAEPELAGPAKRDLAEAAVTQLGLAEPSAGAGDRFLAAAVVDAGGA
jgi:hypothetical protein